MPNRQFCLTLDLRDDAKLIEEYERYHQDGNVWPEVLESIKSSGIDDMRIYRLETRLVMIIEANDSFSFEAKALADQQNAKVQEWEALMEKFQRVDEQNKEKEKWQLMTKIFQS